MVAARLAAFVLVLASCGGMSAERERDRGSNATGGANATGGSNPCTGEDCASGFAIIADFDTTSFPDGLLIGGSIADDSLYVTELVPPNGESRFALHLDDPEELGGAALSYHQHQPTLWMPEANGPGGPYVGIRFWAKRGENGPTSIAVAITGLGQERTSYEDDLAAGRPWLVYRFALTAEWQRYFALFRDFAPEGAGEPAPPYDELGQVVHWLIPRGQALDVWLDDLEFALAQGL